MTCNNKSSPVKLYQISLVLLVISTIFTISNLLITCFWTNIFDYLLRSQLTLTPSSKTFHLWQKNPIPLHIDFYFFNWTNANDVANATIKPTFQQVGPYRFREDKYKVNLTWNANKTVTFKQQRFWYFVANESLGTLDDIITSINVVPLAAAKQTQYAGYFMQSGVSLTLSTVAELTITKSIREILFDGFDDPLIRMAKTMEAFQDIKVPYDKFGWFYQRNGTTDFDGVFNMGTGEDDFSQFGVLKNWNYAPKTNFYSNQCSMINGSAGEFWPINPTPTNISLFSNDLCRSITFDYEQTVNIKGLNGYKFIGGDHIMDNGTLYPENVCFCNGECMPSGVVNISSCRYGAPGFVSFPHFYHADPYYRNSVEGMKPNKDQHSFHITLEKKTGIPLSVAARFQINILLQPFKHISVYEKMQKVLIPVLWFEQKVEIDDKMSSELIQLLYINEIGVYISLGLTLFGIILMIIFSLNICTHFNGQRTTDEIINRWGPDGTHRKMTKTVEIVRAGNDNRSTSIYCE